MSNETSVHGIIEVPRWRGWEDALIRNMAVIDTLPDEGEWPWLVRGMFHASPDRVSYGKCLISFAAAMKGIEEVWPEWLDKFEALLRRLRWFSVELHLRTEFVGDHDYSWIAKQGASTSSTGSISDWDFKGGPRSFEKIG